MVFAAGLLIYYTYNTQYDPQKHPITDDMRNAWPRGQPKSVTEITWIWAALMPGLTPAQVIPQLA